MKSAPALSPLEAALGEQPLLQGLNARQVQVLADCAMLTEFDAGQIIFNEGDLASRFYLIQSGEVALESRPALGNSTCIQMLGAGDVLGWSWLFPPYRWHFDARALKPVKAIFLYGTRLREHCESDPELGYELVRRMAEVLMGRLQATRRQLTEASTLALRSQREVLNLAAQLGKPSPCRGKNHCHEIKPQLHPKL